MILFMAPTQLKNDTRFLAVFFDLRLRSRAFSLAPVSLEPLEPLEPLDPLELNSSIHRAFGFTSFFGIV